MATTMKAWRFDSVEGGMIKNLQLKSDVPKPAEGSALKPNEILVKVVTVTLNPADYKVPSFPVAGKILCPPTPGSDYSGRVAAVHPSNTDFKVGQAVFGRINIFEFPKRTGALAQYLVAKKNECVSLPEGLSLDDASAIGTAGLTAWDSLQFGDLSGKSVFINGGSGGTGTFAIQIAKILGAKVTTTCSTPNVTLCKELGADEVIDYKVTNVLDTLKAGGQVYDLAVDNVGQDLSLLKESQSYLKPKANYVQVGGAGKVLASAAAYAYLPCIRIGKNPVTMIGVKQRAENLIRLGQWAAEGKLKIIFDSTYSFEEAQKAYEHLTGGRAKGKIAVRVSSAEPPAVPEEPKLDAISEQLKVFKEEKVAEVEKTEENVKLADEKKVEEAEPADSKQVEEIKDVEEPKVSEEPKAIEDAKPTEGSKS
jgi:NADPH:quinone reductase-like Zn-dependent oxidoreductase